LKLKSIDIQNGGIVLELFYKLRCPPARTLSSVTYDAHAPE